MECDVDVLILLSQWLAGNRSVRKLSRLTWIQINDDVLGPGQDPNEAFNSLVGAIDNPLQTLELGLWDLSTGSGLPVKCVRMYSWILSS